MPRYVALRVLQGIFAVFGVSLIVFVAVRLTGDLERFLLPPDSRPEDFARVREEYGLNGPLYEQYIDYLGRSLRGDFGESWRWHDPAFTVILDRLPATLQLAVLSAAISLTIALLVGTLSAVYRGTWVDRLGKTFALMGQSMPTFWGRYR